MNRNYRLGRDGTSAVCDATLVRAEIDGLREALGWRRDGLARADYDDASAVLELRSWMALDDMLAATAVFGDEAPLTLTHEHALMLCELTSAYVAERDVDSYQPLELRERIALLRTLSGPLMDCCCEFTVAQEQVRELSLPV